MEEIKPLEAFKRNRWIPIKTKRIAINIVNNNNNQNPKQNMWFQLKIKELKSNWIKI